MKVTPEIVRYEFIGTEIKVVRSSNQTCIGLYGRVINETRNMFTLMFENRKRTVAKNLSTFHMKLADDTVVEIEGSLLEGRPEDRLKKTIRRLW